MDAIKAKSENDAYDPFMSLNYLSPSQLLFFKVLLTKEFAPGLSFVNSSSYVQVGYNKTILYQFELFSHHMTFLKFQKIFKNWKKWEKMNPGSK